MTFDPKKPVRTRSGIPVDIKFIDGREPWPIAGYVGTTTTNLTRWDENGIFSVHKQTIHDYDLANIAEECRPPEHFAHIRLHWLSSCNDSFSTVFEWGDFGWQQIGWQDVRSPEALYASG